MPLLRESPATPPAVSIATLDPVLASVAGGRLGGAAWWDDSWAAKRPVRGPGRPRRDAGRQRGPVTAGGSSARGAPRSGPRRRPAGPCSRCAGAPPTHPPRSHRSCWRREGGTHDPSLQRVLPISAQRGTPSRRKPPERRRRGGRCGRPSRDSGNAPTVEPTPSPKSTNRRRLITAPTTIPFKHDASSSSPWRERLKHWAGLPTDKVRD